MTLFSKVFATRKIYRFVLFLRCKSIYSCRCSLRATAPSLPRGHGCDRGCFCYWFVHWSRDWVEILSKENSRAHHNFATTPSLVRQVSCNAALEILV